MDKRVGSGRLADFYLRFYSTFSGRSAQRQVSPPHARSNCRKAVVSEYQEPVGAEEAPDKTVATTGAFQIRRVIALRPKEPKYVRQVESTHLPEVVRSILPHEAYASSLQKALQSKMRGNMEKEMGEDGAEKPADANDVDGLNGSAALLYDYLKAITQDKGMVESLSADLRQRQEFEEMGAFSEVAAGPITGDAGPSRKVKIMDVRLVDADQNPVIELNRKLRQLIFPRPPPLEVTAKICYELLQSSFQPNVETFNILITGFTRLRKSALAHAVFNAMVALGIKPNEHTITALLILTIKSGDKEAFHHMADLVQQGFLQLTHLMDNPLEREATLRRRNEQDVKTQKYIMETLVIGYLAFGNPKTARRYTELLAHEYPEHRLSLAVQTAFLRYCAERKNWESGSKLWNSMCTLETIDPTYKIDERAYYWMYRLCKSSPYPSDAHNLLANAAERGLDSHRLIHGLEKDKGLQLRRQTKTLPQKWTQKKEWYWWPEPEPKEEEGSSEGMRVVRDMIRKSIFWPNLKHQPDFTSREFDKFIATNPAFLSHFGSPEMRADMWKWIVRMRLAHLPATTERAVRPQLQEYFDNDPDENLTAAQIFPRTKAYRESMHRKIITKHAPPANHPPRGLPINMTEEEAQVQLSRAKRLIQYSCTMILWCCCNIYFLT